MNWCNAMRVSSEYLPATRAARVELVLLHGWGCDREVWRALLGYVRPWANVTLLDVPGCAPGIGSETTPSREDVLDALLAHCPETAVFLGWSLGGQLALQIAHDFPHRVTGVVTLCANPRFVAEPGWPGVAAPVLSRFTDIAHEQMPAAMRRFHAMQRLGSAKPDVARYPLQRCSAAAAPQLMAQGLAWLDQLDLRGLLPQLDMPQLHLLASEDNLVPVELAGPLAALVGDSRDAVRVLEGVSHIAPMEAPGEIARHLENFLETLGLPQACATAEEDFEKRDVAASFSRAAASYDAAAQLQRAVGNALLARLDTASVQPSTVLDLGCGTGAFSSALAERYPTATRIGLDLADGMVAYAREGGDHSPGGLQQWLVGDAEFLPLASDSVDLVFSSLAVQWCKRPQLLFAEILRVLRPGGRCVFATLGPGTLNELRDAWASVDAHQHVNHFFSTEELSRAVSVVPLAQLHLEAESLVMEYARVKDLLLELKALGAHNVNRRRANGLTSPAALRQMQRAYETKRRGGQLPATYDVIYGILEAA